MIVKLVKLEIIVKFVVFVKEIEVKVELDVDV